MTKERATPEAGFSLIEALVTLFIVSVLAAAGASILSMTLNGRERFEARAARIAELERANAALKADLAQLVRRETRDAYGAPRPFVFAGGEGVPGDPILAFARAGRENPDGLEARGSVAYVEYAVADATLVRRMAVRADPTVETPVAETALLHGVERAEVAFAEDGGWRDVHVVAAGGDARGTFPDAVALTLTLADAGEVRELFMIGVAP